MPSSPPASPRFAPSRLTTALLVAAGLAVVLFAVRGTATSPSAGAAGVVDGVAAKALVASGAKVVDVRTPEEFASGHVPGAVNVPYDQIAKRLAEVGPKDAPVVLYCRTGRRSGIAAAELAKAGYTKVFDMQSATAWPEPLEK